MREQNILWKNKFLLEQMEKGRILRDFKRTRLLLLVTNVIWATLWVYKTLDKITLPW